MNQALLQSAPPVISSSAQDHLWITQTLAGDAHSFAHLVNKYKDPLFDLTYRVLKNRTQGEDVLQDAFLLAYQHLSRFRNESSFSTWMYAIVMNKLRNQLRRKKIIYWSSLDAPPPFRNEEHAPEIAHHEPALDLTIERKMDIEEIKRHVASFPLVNQTIFTMYYFQNLSLLEISERLDRPLGTVKVYLHRSRKILYKKLTP